MSKILVIDDSEFFREQMHILATELDHVCVTAGNGREALDLLKTENDFDLIITDIFMPEMDGIETIEQLVIKYPDTRIIAVSAGGLGMSGAGMLEIASGLGADAVLNKPFGSADFTKVVTEVLAA
ncbi:MAG: response regulator [Blastochloris sp.]|jgi:CheY-like chemotaxis protein|nr:response regulator [Blastochloris sp.]